MNPCEELELNIRLSRLLASWTSRLFPTRIANAAPWRRRVVLRRSCATTGIVHV